MGTRLIWRLELAFGHNRAGMEEIVYQYGIEKCPELISANKKQRQYCLPMDCLSKGGSGVNEPDRFCVLQRTSHFSNTK